MAEREGVTEKLKADNQMEWVARMNNIRNRATEIVNVEMIYTDFTPIWLPILLCAVRMYSKQ